jgi:hypothetical protein
LLRLTAGASTAAFISPWARAAGRACDEQSEAGALQAPAVRGSNLYSELLKSWCDGLLDLQITGIRNPALYGGIACPACALIHGRCGDTVYPLLRMAHSSGDSRYAEAAKRVHEWSEQTVSRADGSWVNDVTLSSWKGITVFHAIALGEALRHHGSVLDAGTRTQWTERLAKAAKFLDGFVTIETGNINYPVTASYAFVVCSEVLGEPHYRDRARDLAHSTLKYFTANGLLFGEGHPLQAITKKKCRPVDLGYNVEESLPALALYALATNDKPVLDQVVASLRAHLEFMLPDGSWDNSWGSRNYKWTWWGSRTSDGCHPAYVLLAHNEPAFREAAWRNLELMAACTHDGLLYGGPHYFEHGDLPCVHHTFTHAKALATVLDSSSDSEPVQRIAIPRDEPAYSVKSFPEIGTYLASIGDWRATVTEYDFEYVERVQAGGSSPGHASGGALSLLFHRKLGPVIAASMTEYRAIEISNQQAHKDYPHMTLTPRIEFNAGGEIYTSLSDFEAVLQVLYTGEEIKFDAKGRLLNSARASLPNGGAHYSLGYRLRENKIELVAATDAEQATRFVVPIVSPQQEALEQPDGKTVRIAKQNGTLVVRTDAVNGFEKLPAVRTFNLVPGFECLPLIVVLQPEKEVSVGLSVEQKTQEAATAIGFRL